MAMPAIMNSPPIVGVAFFARCSCAISGEAVLIGSRKRLLSHPIDRGPKSMASAKLAIAARPAHVVILASASAWNVGGEWANSRSMNTSNIVRLSKGGVRIKGRNDRDAMCQVARAASGAQSRSLSCGERRVSARTCSLLASRAVARLTSFHPPVFPETPERPLRPPRCSVIELHREALARGG